MRVLIIGTGNMGRGLATRALAGGHAVTLYNEDPAKAEALAADLAASAERTPDVAVTASPDEAIPASDVVVLATPYAASLDVARRLGGALAGKVVVDISNPFNATFDALVTAPDTSAAEAIQAALPGARVVKAFNTTFAAGLAAGRVAGQPLDVFIAGDDQAAKDAVAALARDGGLVPYDVGPLAHARQLEALGLLGASIQARLATRVPTAWKLLVPTAR